MSPPRTHAHTSISLYTFTAPHPLPQWPLAHVTSSPPPSETPIVPTQPKCPEMLMTCCHSAYKQNDMIYCNYRFRQLRNENARVGRRSTVGEGLAQLPTDSRPCSDKDLLILFLFFFYFSKMFFLFLFCSAAIEPPSSYRLLLHLHRPRSAACCEHMFVLLGRSLPVSHTQFNLPLPWGRHDLYAFKKSCTKLNCGGPTSTYPIQSWG